MMTIFGMAVTGIGHTDAAGEIEVSSAVGGVDVRAFSAFRFNRENTSPNGRHVGEVLFVKLGHFLIFLLGYITFFSLSAIKVSRAAINSSNRSN